MSIKTKKVRSVLRFRFNLQFPVWDKITGINLQSPSIHNPNQHLFTTKTIKIIVPVQASMGIEPLYSHQTLPLFLS